MDSEIEIQQAKNNACVQTDNLAIPVWEDTSGFDPNWLTLIRQYQQDLFPPHLMKKESIKPWFVYYFNENDKAKSTYGCRLCKEYYDQLKLNPVHKPVLANPEGTLKRDRHQNTNTISKHRLSKSHMAVIAALKASKRKT